MSAERTRGTAGFMLLEMLIGVLIFGLIVLCLDRVLATALSSSGGVGEKEDVLTEARLAMERMVAFAQESDEIASPVSGSAETLKVSERIDDMYNNASHVYVAAGDTLPDADRNSDGLIDGNDGSARDYVTFSIDRSDGGNWKLMEQAPDYGGAAGSTLAARAICGHVTQFTCTRLSSSLVTILLTVSSGGTTVTLQTRARARLIE